ncbi:MAG TPA: 3-dehydroquinate synthase [Xanthomonadales bacterium]|nr:3-dehydroquinate synthase [Xanthomonadales bacterium]
MTDHLTVQIELGQRSYPVHIGPGLLSQAEPWQVLSAGKTLVVSNEVVAPLYLDALLASLGDRDCVTHIIADGEPHKTLATWSGIIDQLVGMQARRDCNLVALGGGVVGDICGFAAAAYMRGVRFFQVPTTLLAQVDSSVGGKTGVNHPKGKNLVGAFHQPGMVLIDTQTLESLPLREFRAGMAEVVKYGAIMDLEFLAWLEKSVEAINGRQSDALSHLIQRSVQNKARVVAADETEAGIRAILNFGHSFGHALEAITAYSEFLHGEAVAIGMVVAARLSEIRGLCPAGTAARLDRLLQVLGLPTALPGHVSNAAMLEALQLDKKAVAGGLRLILLQDAGNAVIDAASSRDQIESALDSCR